MTSQISQTASLPKNSRFEQLRQIIDQELQRSKHTFEPFASVPSANNISQEFKVSDESSHLPQLPSRPKPARHHTLRHGAGLRRRFSHDVALAAAAAEALDLSSSAVSTPRNLSNRMKYAQDDPYEVEVRVVTNNHELKLGFVEVPNQATAAELRKKVEDELDHVPARFFFVAYPSRAMLPREKEHACLCYPAPAGDTQEGSEEFVIMDRVVRIQVVST